MKVLFLVLSFVAQTAVAQDCVTYRKDLEAQFDQLYQVDHLQQITFSVRKVATTDEIDQIQKMADDFKLLLPDMNKNLNELFRLQDESRLIVRNQTLRAGFKVTNALPSPYDAVIESKMSADGLMLSVIEVRGLLVLADPFAHATLWMKRADLAHNPFKIISVGVLADPDQNYVSFVGSQGNREQLLKSEFLDQWTKANCTL